MGAPRGKEAQDEKERRERERREFKEAQELESLRRTFKRINKQGDGKISVADLMEELNFLGFKVSKKEAALIIWEVDDDNDSVGAPRYPQYVFAAPLRVPPARLVMVPASRCLSIVRTSVAPRPSHDSRLGRVPHHVLPGA